MAIIKVIKGDGDKLCQLAHKKLIEFITSPSIEIQEAAKNQLLEIEDRLRRHAHLRSV